MHKFKVNPKFGDLHSTNSILTAKVKSHYRSSYTTNLSLKTLVKGQARYATKQSVYSVEPETFVLLNRGQTYDLEIAPDTGTETLAIFFEPSFVQSCMAAATIDGSVLLDDPNSGAPNDASFIETLQPVTGQFGKVVNRIKTSLILDPGGESWIEDSLYELIMTLPEVSQHSTNLWIRLPCKKLATRRELFRRLAHSRDYAYSCYQENLSVEIMANVAEMSPFHFHRMFCEAFGVTPNAFVRERRLTMALRLLERGYPVTQVCFDVGYEGLGHFCSLFKKRFGLTPRQAAKKTTT